MTEFRGAFTLPAASGRISEFGGEGDVNSLAVSGGSTTNPPDPYYIAMRWGADGRANYRALARQRVAITFGGRTVIGYPGDWGPAAWTGRVVDVAPILMRALGATTDDIVTLRWMPEGTPTGPYAGGGVPAPGGGVPGPTITTPPSSGEFAGLTRPAWWQRVGLGVLGVALVGVGISMTFGPLLARETL